MVEEILNEKYRPKKLDDIVGQEHTIELLKKYVANKNIPHMLFAGLTGTGKTTCAQALARELYGDNWGKYFYEMNASNERKLKDVREKIKPYAQAKVIDEDFRIIFLDEVDHMDWQAQPALRRIIEKYSSTCRFILSCNYPNKVIEPIKDRCTPFRFSAIKKDEMKKMLRRITTNESIDISEGALDTLCRLSKGSMRKAIGTLEKLHNANIVNISEETIQKYFCYIDDEDLKDVVRTVMDGNLKATSEFVEGLLYEKAYAPEEIISAFELLLRESKILSVDGIVDANERLGEAEFRISVGCDPEIQLKTFFISLYKQYKNNGV